MMKKLNLFLIGLLVSLLAINAIGGQIRNRSRLDLAVDAGEISAKFEGTDVKSSVKLTVAKTDKAKEGDYEIALPDQMTLKSSREGVQDLIVQKIDQGSSNGVIIVTGDQSTTVTLRALSTDFYADIPDKGVFFTIGATNKALDCILKNALLSFSAKQAAIWILKPGIDPETLKNACVAALLRDKGQSSITPEDWEAAMTATKNCRPH